MKTPEELAEAITIHDPNPPSYEDTYLTAAFRERLLAEKEIEAVKREYFESGLSIGSRNPGIHESLNVYDTYIGLTKPTLSREQRIQQLESEIEAHLKEDESESETTLKEGES